MLAAEKDSILLIENPESHLHPQGQSKLAELMALAAQNGIQIFIETHSEHIINGSLVAVKKYHTESRGIANDKIRIYYLEHDEIDHATKSIEVPVFEDENTPNNTYHGYHIDNEDEVPKNIRRLLSQVK